MAGCSLTIIRRDPLAYRILEAQPRKHVATRRWYYFIPAQGDPKGLVHAIESGVLAGLPGRYPQVLQLDRAGARHPGICLPAATRSRCSIRRTAPSRMCRWWTAARSNLVRGTGVEIVTSANLVQLFEARWTAEQLEMHLEAGRRVDRVRAEAFQKIAAALAADQAITEWDVNRFIRAGFENAGLVTDHGPIVAVNANMSDPHYEPAPEGSREIRKGDAVLIDMWAKLDQPPRRLSTTSPGPASAAARRLPRFKTSLKLCAMPAIAPSNAFRPPSRAAKLIHGFDVDDAARAYISDQGFGELFHPPHRPLHRRRGAWHRRQHGQS